jgi:tetratricopeptide (TPR) repeat protein
MVLKLRNTLNRLADELISMNRIDSAVNVIDKAVELLPHKKFPYDFFVLGQIEGYYKANETDKANRLLLEYVGITDENLNYYFSLSGSFAKITTNEKEYNLEILRELLSIATKNGQTDIQKSIEEKFNFFVDQHYRR